MHSKIARYTALSLLTLALGVIPAVSQTLHYAANSSSAAAAASAVGFNVFDITGLKNNPNSLNNTINALPTGSKALVWLGNLDNTNCVTPGYTLAQFEAQVDALAANSRVLGYFIADEPHPGNCSNAVTDIAARADYVHAHAPGQIAFITVQDGDVQCPNGLGCEYGALAPANSHVDLIGIDPYPCHFDSHGNPVPCDNSQIISRVQAAEANGVSVSAIVPVFDEFGQEGRIDGKQIFYRTPSTTELQSMLTTWAGLVPNPVFDFAYTWGVQCTASSCPAPQALANHTELQAIAAAHNLDAQHYVTGSDGSEATVAALGFNVLDVTGSDDDPADVKTAVDALPAGTRALVWMGNLDSGSCSSDFTATQFQAQVNALANDSKVFGYYIADDPHPGSCATTASDIKARADYIHTNAPGQVAFITVDDGTSTCGGSLGCEYSALKPSNTDIDLMGIHPYPCHYDANGSPVPCDNSQITDRVNAALDNGVPLAAIVPVFQEFGEEGRTDGGQVYYRTPSATELQSMLDTWSGLVANPKFDYVYTWETSSSEPQALSNHTELQAVAQQHNAK